MTSRQPPALATRLLQRMGIADQNPPLAGDLLEEFQNGRSTAWYWRQTFVAIATGFRRSLWVFRFYFLAGFLAFAAQAGVSFVLWSHAWPRPLHGGSMIALGVLYAAWLSERWWNPWRSDPRRRRRSRTDPGSVCPAPPARFNEVRFNEVRFHKVLAAVVAGSTFTAFLCLYIVNSLLWSWDSLASWIWTEAIWLLTSVTVASGVASGLTFSPPRGGRQKKI